MIARAIPLNTDSIIFRNWAPAGKGAKPTLVLKFRKVGAFLEEILVRLLQVLQGMLQWVAGRVFQPRRFRAIAPPGQVLRHGDVADEPVSSFVIFFLHRQRLVVDEPA